MPEISIIVPVYNADTLLNRCIDSIISQSYSDFECILVNDGSTDDSGAICDSYAKSDNRFRVIHKKNGGVSSARQRGLDEAIGEFTIHVDPDDWIDPHMLRDLYDVAEREQSDFVICDYFVNYTRVQQSISQEPKDLTHISILKQLVEQQMHGSCCNKLVRRECYNRFGVTFPFEVTMWEDLYVNCCLLYNNIKVSYLPKAYYHYDCSSNPTSITHSRTKRKVESKMTVARYLMERLGNDGSIDFYYMLKDIKLGCIASGLYSHEEIVNLYKDINERFLGESKYSIHTPLVNALRMILNGYNPNVTKCVYKISRFLQEAYNQVRY